MSDSVRVRFAPSPTGYLHVGGARTALFNWLFARRMGGKLILRIEDTDAARNTEAAMQAIYDGLQWLGLDWDEGPLKGGDHGPYFQSERNAIYETYLKKLQDGGHVYEDGGAIRFRSLRKTQVVDDLVCGRVEFDLSDPSTHPDMTIRRPDGSWIFHFVNVVDDIEMKMTHVIRGEDHLSNTPKHLELYEALGATPPRFAHIPLILNIDGSKMSKRDTGASMNSYVEGGYVPEAVRNFLCLLGWSPKDDQEKMEIEDVIARFELEKIHRKAAHFDIAKCDWLNQQYIIHIPIDRLTELAAPFCDEAGVLYGDLAKLTPVLALVRERLKHLTDTPSWVDYFFTEDFAYDQEAVTKTLRKPGAAGRLATLTEVYGGVANWTASELETALKAKATELACKPAEFIHPARVGSTGRAVGASLYHTLEVLGKDLVLARFNRTLEMLAAPVS